MKALLRTAKFNFRFSSPRPTRYDCAMLKRRNPYATHPLLRKGGAHQPAKAKPRQGARRDIRKALDEVSKPRK